MIAHELRNLNESLQAITYAALGTQARRSAAAERLNYRRRRDTLSARSCA